MSHITLQALSPDNSARITQLIELFSDCYGNGFPIQGVYSQDFWRKRLSKGLITLGVYEDRHLVGQISIAVDSKDPTARHILFPFIASEHPEAEQLFLQELQRVCERLALLQNWSYVTLYQDASRNISTTHHALGFVPIGYVLRGDETHTSRDISISQRHYRVGDPRTLFLNPAMESAATKMYSRLGLNIEVISSAQKTTGARRPSPTRRSKQRFRSFPFQIGMRQTVISRGDDRRLPQVLENGQHSSDIAEPLLVDCSVPDSIEVLDRCIAHGFHVTGIVPIMGRNDAVILGKRSVASVSRRSALDEELLEIQSAFAE